MKGGFDFSSFEIYHAEIYHQKYNISDEKDMLQFKNIGDTLIKEWGYILQ